MPALARASPTEVQITPRGGGEPYIIAGDYITIATGGLPTTPSEDQMPGANLGIDSDGFFNLEDQPKCVAVVGAGSIAVELAGVLHTLGSETHVLIRHEHVLRTFDPVIQDTRSFSRGRVVSIHIIEQGSDDLRVAYLPGTGTGMATDIRGFTPAVPYIGSYLHRLNLNHTCPFSLDASIFTGMHLFSLVRVYFHSFTFVLTFTGSTLTHAPTGT